MTDTPEPQGRTRERADARANRERIVEAAGRLLAQSPSTTLSDIAAAAGVSRSTIYRHFPDRDALANAVETRPRPGRPQARETDPAGRLGREGPVPLEAINALDTVIPFVLPDQLVAEAQRLAEVALALYVIDIDGSHLLRIAGPSRLPARLKAPLAVGPELDRDGVAQLRDQLAAHPGLEIVPLWLRGRALGILLALGQPRRSLASLARQAAAAIVLADRYTDVFARAKRRKQPQAAAEIQQSLLPPRISWITGGEVAGNILPSYEVAGDWFDVVENLDGVWLALANGLGGGTQATASSAVALGALRACRRSGGTIPEAMTLMHRTLTEMPGPGAEMNAVIARWDPVSRALTVANCGHFAPAVIHEDGTAEQLEVPAGHGLGGRARPTPRERVVALESGDRLLLVSDGVVLGGSGRAGLGIEGVIAAARRSERRTAADTVRRIHTAVLKATEGELEDDATAVCLAVT